MSIPLKNSPFKGDDLPCIHCAEHNGDSIICKETEQPCDPKFCTSYEPFKFNEYRNNLKNSMRPTWVRKESDTYYYICCSRCSERLPRSQWNREYHSKYCPSCGHHLYVEGEEVEDVAPGIYQHFKGRQYEVLGTGVHTETSEKYVVYRALYGKYQLYIRPLSMFAEDVEDIQNKYRGPRFFKIDTED